MMEAVLVAEVNEEEQYHEWTNRTIRRSRNKGKKNNDNKKKNNNTRRARARRMDKDKKNNIMNEQMEQ